MGVGWKKIPMKLTLHQEYSAQVDYHLYLNHWYKTSWISNSSSTSWPQNQYFKKLEKIRQSSQTYITSIEWWQLIPSSKSSHLISTAWTHQSGITDCQDGSENGIQLYAAYKRLIRTQDKHRSKVKEWKTHLITIKTSVARHILYNTEFKFVKTKWLLFND